MNKRIGELAEQAGLEYNFDPMTWLKYEKFAELIIQECIKEMEEFTIMSEDYVQWNQALSHVALYLKDHFGIDQ